MAFKTLDLEVYVSGDTGTLDDIADKLDTIHRKASKVRQNKVGFDVDGDSESIARSQAVKESAEDVDGTYTANIRTSGGKDVRDTFDVIESRVGQLQGRVVESGARLDYDESYVNTPLDDFRETISDIDSDDLDEERYRKLQTSLGTSDRRLSTAEDKLFFDTSGMRDELHSIQDDLRETFVGEDYEGPTFDHDDETHVRRMVHTDEDDVNLAQSFADIERELQTHVEDIDDGDERDVDTDIEDTVRNVRDEYVSDGDAPTVGDTHRTIRQQYSELDDRDVADLSRTIHERIDRADSEPPSVDDLVRTVRTKFEDYDVPTVDDTVREVRDKYVGGDTPSIEDTERVIRQRFSQLDDSGVRDLTQRIHRTFEDRDEPPSMSDTVRRVKTVFDDYDTQTVDNAVRTIHTNYTEGEQPSLDETTQFIEREFSDTDVDTAEDISRTIHDSYTDVDDPSVDDITRHVRTVFDEYAPHDVPDEYRTVHTRFADTDVPDRLTDVQTAIDNDNIDRAVRKSHELRETLSSLDGDIEPQFEQRIDTFTQTLENRVDADGDVVGDDDVVNTDLRRQLSNIDDRVHSVRPHVDYDPIVDTDHDIGSDIDVSDFDVDTVTDRLDTLKSDLQERRELYESYDIDVDEKVDRVSEIERRIKTSVDEDSFDETTLRGINGEFDELFDDKRKSRLRDTTKRFDKVGTSIGEINDRIRQFRLGNTDLTQSFERGRFSQLVSNADSQLHGIERSVLSEVDPGSRGNIEDATIDVRENEALSKIAAVRASLAALDDTVVDPSIETDTERSARLQSLSDVIDTEMTLGGDDDGQTRLSDFDAFSQKLGEYDGDISDLSDTLTGEFDKETEAFTPLQQDEIERTPLDKFRSGPLQELVGAQNYVNFRGTDAFEKSDFLGDGFEPTDLLDSDQQLSVHDIFDFDGRELTDVFESERSFRAYLNPESDVDLGGAMRSDRDVGDLVPESRGLRKKFEKWSDLDFNDIWTMFAKLVPLLATWVVALPAAIGGVIALGGAALAAAATLGAVGALSIGGLALSLGDGDIKKGLKEIKSELVSDAKESLAPLARQFDDVGRETLDNVGEFFDRLGAEGQSLTRLKDEFIGLEDYIVENAPAAIDDLVALTQSFAPLFSQFGEWLVTTDILGGFVGVAQQALPPLLQIIDAVLAMLPAIMKFSEGMLIVTGATFKFWSMVWQLIDAIGPLGKYLGIIAGAVLTLYTTITLASYAMGVLTTLLSVNAIKSIIAFIGGIGEAILSLFGLTTAAGEATLAVNALRVAIGGTGIGLLLVAVSSLASGFLTTSDSIDEATKSLSDFNDMRDGMDSDIDNPYGPIKMGAKTGVDPNVSAKTGVEGESGGDGRGSNRRGRGPSGQNGGGTTINNIDNSTEINADNGSSRDIGEEISHDRFKSKEKSSKPYSSA